MDIYSFNLRFAPSLNLIISGREFSIGSNSLSGHLFLVIQANSGIPTVTNYLSQKHSLQFSMRCLSRWAWYKMLVGLLHVHRISWAPVVSVHEDIQAPGPVPRSLQWWLCAAHALPKYLEHLCGGVSPCQTELAGRKLPQVSWDAVRGFPSCCCLQGSSPSADFSWSRWDRRCAA